MQFYIVKDFYFLDMIKLDFFFLFDNFQNISSCQNIALWSII